MCDKTSKSFLSASTGMKLFIFLEEGDSAGSHWGQTMQGFQEVTKNKNKKAIQILLCKAQNIKC